MLVDGNINAADAIEKLQPLLKDTECSEYLARVARAVEEYEFDTASEAAKSVADHFCVNL